MKAEGEKGISEALVGDAVGEAVPGEAVGD